MDITIDSQVKGSGEERSYREEESGRIFELVELKLVEIKERLSRLKEILQKKIERCGWRMKKKSKWPIRKLQERNSKCRLNIWVNNEEKFKEAKYEVEVHYCEPEQESILREKEEYTDEIFMNYWESSNQHEEMIPKALEEVIESYVFKTNGLCVISSYKNDEDGKPYIVVMKGNKVLSPKGIKEVKNQNSIVNEDEGSLSYIDNQSTVYTQLVNALVGKQLPKLIVVETRTQLACEDNHVKDE